MLIAFACVIPFIAAMLTFILRTVYVEHTSAKPLTQDETASALSLALGVGVIVFVVSFAALFLLFAASFEM
jgi:hypothetical protein